MIINIDANTILRLLLKKYCNDLCISECKTGSTWWDKKYFKMDLWVMKKSWSKPNTFCFEIKVTRSDFINDKKWREYLNYCTDFYFVAPPGIIKPNELPGEAGLIETSKNGKRLFTRKLAVTRKAGNLESVYKYVLMWRSIQKSEKEIISAKSYWEEWLNNKKLNYKFGHIVSEKIRKTIEDRIESVKRENIDLRQENINLKKIKEIIIELGFTEHDLQSFYYNTENRLRNKIKSISHNKLNDFETYLDQAILNIKKIRSTIKEIS